MGAIFGLVGEGSLDEVRAMGGRMPHRGAQQRVWSPAPGVYLGERSALAESAGGALAIDLQSDLESPRDVASSLRGGIGSLAGLDANFSLAWWDERAHALLLAADPSGYKSLYCAQLPGRLVFASEYKALLAFDELPAALDRDSAQAYLAKRSFRMGFPLLAGVRALTPGTRMLYREGQLESERYWSPLSRPVQRSAAEYARMIRERLCEVVARQARKFSQVGMTLSAGLDSASLVAVLRHVRPEVPIHSFTIGHGEDDAEILGGRELAAAFETRHRELFFDPACVPALLPKLVWLMEECSGREESLLQHLVLAEAGRTGQQVVMGAYAADSLFAGMPRHKLLRMRELFPWLSTPLTEVFQLTQCGAEPRSLLGRAGKGILFGRRWFPPPQVAGATAPVEAPDPGSLDQYLADGMLEAYDSSYLEPTLEAAGVEFRDPFQSLAMMDLALSIPARFNVTLRRQKGLLRDALADLLPESIRTRKKSIQRVRHDGKLSEVLDAMADELLGPETLRARGIVDPAYLEALRRRAPGAPYATERIYRLWTLLCLELWSRQFLDQRGLPAGFAP